MNRRSFIASITAFGLLSAMPSPVRAWAKGLYLPKGTKIISRDGRTLAITNRDIWSREMQSTAPFNWIEMKEPRMGDSVSTEFFIATNDARKRLGLI